MSQPTQGPVLKERVWRFIEALLTRAEDSPNFDVGWEADKNTGRPNFVVKTKRRFLESLAQLKTQELTEVIKSLENLQIWDDRRLRRGKGSEIGSFALKLWSTDAQRNWEQFESVWEASRTAKSKALEATYNKPKDSAEASEDKFGWQNICLAMLKKQKRLTTNELLSADEDMKFELDDIHVPLALVQRTKPDKRGGDVSPEVGSRLLQPTYEEKQRFRHEEFLAQVLQQGKGHSKGRRIAVIGEPGAGKTTLLQSIALWLFEDKNKNLGLPIWISLADLQGKTLEEYLLQRWLKNALEVVRVTPEQENALVELFKKERVWLFLDGVDEIAGGSLGANHELPLQMVASQLEGWVAKARVVLSCRLNVWEANINALGDDFETYRLLDFDYPLQVKEFICRWFRKSDANKGERLWTELDKSERPRIQDLVKNPLRLALLCSTYDPDPPSPPYQGGSTNPPNLLTKAPAYQGGSKGSLSSPPYQGGARGGTSGLPSTKAGLYQRFVEVFYTWKKNRFPTTFEQRQELNAALGRLALTAIDSEVSRFRLRHKVVCEVLGDPEQENSLFGLALQLGWLNKVGLAAESETQEKVYAFYHPTFQEYFAALAIADWDFFLPRAHNNHNPKPVSERYRIFEPQWKEVILLWLGREEVAKEQFIQALVEFNDGCREWLFGYEGFYEYRAYFLAAVGIAEFRECSLANKIVKQVVKWSFGENFNYQMQQTQLRRMFAPRQMAERAKATLLEMHHPFAVIALIEVMHTSLDEYTRIEVAEIVGKIDPGNSVAIATLIEIMHNSERSWCTKAVRSLGKIAKSNQEAIAALVNLLHTIGANPDEWLIPIEVEVAASLSKIDPEHPEAIPVVEDSALYSTFFQDAVRLGQINPNKPEWIAALVDQVKFIPTSEREEFNRLWAVQHLKASNTTDSEAVAALIDLIRSNPDHRTLLEAVRSLGRIGKSAPEAIDLLIDLSYNSPNWVIREIAIQGLSYTDTSHEKVINALIELIRITPDQQIRIDAAQSLGQILQGYPLESAVSALKNTLPTQINDNNDVHLYKECYQVLLHSAQNMTYPAFYQAWHQQEEVDNTTTPNTQTLNQADLPQSLQSAIANDTQLRQTIHLICIDGSQIIEPDRPAAEIYDQMLDQNCPEYDRVPETMPALKLYWNSLRRNSDKRPVLVFYASSTNPYNESFVTVLSKFGREICVITEQPLDHIPLQFFTPSQPIADVVEWIRAIATSP